MNKSVKGSTIKEHLKQVEKQTGRTPKELIKPPFPESLGHVWLAFLELSPSRGYSEFGMMPLTYTEIKSYLEVTGTILDPREVSVLKSLDLAYLECMNG